MPKTTATEPEPTEEATAIVAAETDLQPILAEYVEFNDTSLTFKKKPPIKKWLLIADFTQGIRSRTQWWIGDSLNFGEKEYGEKYAQAVNEHGKSESRLQTYAYVCSRFEKERRRPEISFDHHSEAAGLPPQEADRILTEAIKKRWSKMDIRAEVTRYHEINQTPGRRTRKPGSTTAKLAASGNTPQPTEPEPEPAPAPPEPAPAPPPTHARRISPPKPEPKGNEFFWNGYPILTQGEQIFAPEAMSDTEATSCAHSFGFGTISQFISVLRLAGNVTTAAKYAQPEAQETAQQAPDDPGAYDHGKAMNRVMGAIADLDAAIEALDFDQITTLDAKKLLKHSIPFDDAIDRWQQITGATPTAR